MKITIGIRAIVAAAAIGPQSKVLLEMKLATNTGRVFEFSPAIITGIKNSFHERSAIKTPVATIPGIASGRRILRNICVFDAPSTRAASSSSIGICLKKDVKSQIAKGRLKPA